MEKFEAGGVYRDDGVEIEVLKRTEKRFLIGLLVLVI